MSTATTGGEAGGGAGGAALVDTAVMTMMAAVGVAVVMTVEAQTTQDAASASQMPQTIPSSRKNASF